MKVECAFIERAIFMKLGEVLNLLFELLKG